MVLDEVAANRGPLAEATKLPGQQSSALLRRGYRSFHDPICKLAQTGKGLVRLFWNPFPAVRVSPVQWDPMTSRAG